MGMASKRIGWRICMLTVALGLFAVPASAQTQVRIGMPGNSLGFGAWFLADEGGLLAKNGLHAKFVFLAANAIPAALTTGGIEATPLTETVMAAAMRGYAVRDVALTTHRSVNEILARGNITTMEQLKGKTVVTSPPRALPAQLVRYFVKQAGLVPGKDVKLLYIGSQASRQTLLLSGNADAILESTTLALQLRDRLPSIHVLKRERDMPQQLADGMGTSVALIKKKPDLVRRMVRALAEADAKARANPGWAAEVLAKRLKMPNHGKELAETLIAAMPDGVNPAPELYRDDAQFISSNQKRPVTAAQVKATWDTRFAVQVDREMMAHVKSGASR